jgi:hypothetical protein
LDNRLLVRVIRESQCVVRRSHVPFYANLPVKSDGRGRTDRHLSHAARPTTPLADGVGAEAERLDDSSRSPSVRDRGVLVIDVELGVYRARVVDGSRLALGGYLSEGVRVDGGLPDEHADEAVGTIRPYLVGGTLLSILLGVDAALLAGGLAML